MKSSIIDLLRRLKIALGLIPVTKKVNTVSVLITNADFDQIYSNTYIIVYAKIINSNDNNVEILKDIIINPNCERIENIKSQNNVNVFNNDYYLFDRQKEFSKSKVTTIMANKSVDKVLIFKTNYLPFIELTFIDKSGTEIKISSDVINKIITQN